MRGELLILFVILLLGLILCSFLGGKGCIEGMENNSYSSEIFYEPNGAYAELQQNPNGSGNSLVVTTSDGTATTYKQSDVTSDTYIGSNGNTAILKNGSYGINVIQVKDKNGKVLLTLTNEPNKGIITTTNNTQNEITIHNYDNYDHYNKKSYPTIFYGPNGGTAKVIQTPNDNSIVITNKNGTTEIYYIAKDATDPDVSTYYGPNGGSAKMIKDSNGTHAVEITKPNGSKIVYSAYNIYTYDGQDDTINQYDVDNNTTGADINASTCYGPYGGQSTTLTGPTGNTYSSYDSSAYFNSLPQGIPRNQIPKGDEDLYILKSQVVPPVCPKCPSVIQKCPDNFDVTKCPACPPCSRCPEPAFDCKKVPNYNAFNQNYMPVPVLSDFSGFGM
jgi:hypothetical protein